MLSVCVCEAERGWLGVCGVVAVVVRFDEWMIVSNDVCDVSTYEKWCLAN